MSAFIFMGPTLAVAEAQGILDATYLPPASQGDVFRLVATTDAEILGIIDGNFQEVPAVWHKELLWAMSQGIHVLGAASMGALRAAELAEFGMQGEGRIFEAYRSGRLMPWDDAPFEDDDEVAIVHAPADLGYQPLSDALVDIRCTLDSAVRQAVVPPSFRDQFLVLAKSCFYAERTYDALLTLAEREGFVTAELKQFANWLKDGKVNQKKDDAITLLRTIAARDLKGKPKPSFDFQHTSMWDRFSAEALSADGGLESCGLGDMDLAALSELRLCLEEFTQVRSQAERALRIGPCPLVRCVALAMARILRRNGQYSRFVARAEAKQSSPACHDAPQADQLTGLQQLQLMDWYFGRLLGYHIPDDIEGFARSLGYPDRASFLQDLVREYAFTNGDDPTTRRETGRSGAT